MAHARRRLALALSSILVASLVGASPASATTTVSGTVTGPGGEPLSGTVWFCPGPDYLSCGGNNFTGGSFSLPKPDGDVKIRVSIPSMDNTAVYYLTGQPGGTPDVNAATVFTLAGTPLTLPPLQFSAIATLAGTVTNGDGDPMSGITVFRNRQGQVASTTTDTAGHYDFGYVRAGSMVVSVNRSAPWAAASQNVTVPASGAVTADLVMVAGAHVAGTLTDADSGAPIPFLEVLVFRLSDSAYQDTATTDAAGHFDVAGLGSGGFALRYQDNLGGYPPTFNGGALVLGSATPIPLTAGQTTTHDEALTMKAAPWTDAGTTLGGTVTDDLGAPLAGMSVEVSDGSGTLDVVSSDRLGRWAATVPAGDVHVRVEQGPWQTQYYPSPTPWFPEFYPDGWTAAQATSVTVPPTGQQLGVDVALGRSAVLDLQVTGPGGSTDLNAGYQVRDAATGAVAAEQQPVASGGPHLPLLLRPGSWKILVSGRTPQGANATPLLSQWYAGGVSLRSAGITTLGAGERIDGATITLPDRLATTTKPKVKGRAKVGRKLTVTQGLWNLMTGTTFSYRWKRGSATVSRTKAYRVRSADRGKRLVAVVKATNGFFTSTAKVTVRVR